VAHGDVVPVERVVLDALRRGRGGQLTAPPGYPAAAEPGEKRLQHAARQ
jgi:hypothetical protein